MPENLLIIQGGGPTAVFNASLASIVREALAHRRISRIFGARSGMAGLSRGAVVDLSHLTPADLLAIRNSPGATLGSSRFKPTEEDLGRCVEHLRRLEVRHLVFMGGNGTMRGAEIVRGFCRAQGFDVQIMGVPKTIDNDVAATDRCPGFASAARFVAQSTLDLAMDIRSLPQPVSIFETLGRDVGWLAASANLAKADPDDAPHLVYLPEIPFSQEKFLGDLDRVVSRIGWAVVIVSEGIAFADGTPVFQQQVLGPEGSQNRPLIGGVAHHLSGLVGGTLGIRCRSEKPGLIGRSCMAQVSPQDLADAELVGQRGVQSLLAGESDQMVALLPLPGHAASSFELVPLAKAAGPPRSIPAEWLSGDQLAVNELFRDYVRPLVGPLSVYQRPLGEHHRFVTPDDA